MLTLGVASPTTAATLTETVLWGPRARDDNTTVSHYNEFCAPTGSILVNLPWRGKGFMFSVGCKPGRLLPGKYARHSQ